MVSTILSLFPDAHISSGYARVRCPYHKDGKEKKPSMSILLEPRGNAPRGLCHCFACGKAVMFDQLLKDMGAEAMPAKEIGGEQHREGVTIITTPPVYKPQLPFKFSPYLAGRGIGEDVQKRFKVFEKDDFVHMPVFDRHGMYLYDNARSTTSKRFYVEAGAKKSLWAIEEIDLSRPIVVCESQIDAMSMWQAGFQAVATLGADNVRSLVEIKQATSLIVLGFDPDDAGVRARTRAASMLGKYRCRWLDLPEGVDVNQALQDIPTIDKFKKFMQRSTRDFRT